MTRFLLAGLLAVLMISCTNATSSGSVRKGEGTDAPEVAKPQPTPVVRTPVPPPPLPEKAFEPALLPEQLQGVLGIRDYEYRREGRNAILSLVMENLRVSEPLVLEVAARFEGENGESLAQTDWVRVTIAPRRRHPYEASLEDPRIATGKVVMRLVEKQEK